jgi:hypothetical protein
MGRAAVPAGASPRGGGGREVRAGRLVETLRACAAACYRFSDAEIAAPGRRRA